MQWFFTPAFAYATNAHTARNAHTLSLKYNCCDSQQLRFFTKIRNAVAITKHHSTYCL